MVGGSCVVVVCHERRVSTTKKYSGRRDVQDITLHKVCARTMICRDLVPPDKKVAREAITLTMGTQFCIF